MKEIVCRICGKAFPEDEIAFEDCYETPEDEDEARRQAICPFCGAPVYDTLDCTNVEMDYNLPCDFNIYNNRNNVVRSFSLSEYDCIIKDEKFFLTVEVKKTFESEQDDEDVCSIVWDAEYPNNSYKNHGSVDIPEMQIGETKKVQIVVPAMQRGEYNMTVSLKSSNYTKVFEAGDDEYEDNDALDAANEFETIEVAELFTYAYVKACIATREQEGNTKQVEIRKRNLELIEKMFYSLKMTRIMQLPPRWLSENSASQKLRTMLDEDNYPELLAAVAITQEKAQELVNQLNMVVYSRNGCGICQITYGDIASDIRIGTDAFIEDTSFIIREMKDKGVRKEVIDELKLYL